MPGHHNSVDPRSKSYSRTPPAPRQPEVRPAPQHRYPFSAPRACCSPRISLATLIVLLGAGAFTLYNLRQHQTQYNTNNHGLKPHFPPPHPPSNPLASMSPTPMPPTPMPPTPMPPAPMSPASMPPASMPLTPMSPAPMPPPAPPQGKRI